MSHTTIHARWRVLPVHLVAKLFGVLIKVEGMPFGSNRTRLANPLAGIQAHMAAAAEISARSCSALAAFAALQRLADAAGKLPPSAPDAVAAK